MPPALAAKKRKFDTKTFLSTIECGRKVAVVRKKQTIFAQGDSSDAVFYIQKGKVRLTVVSKSGKEATIGILNDGDFFGEGCLAGQPLRLCSATAMTDCSVMQIVCTIPYAKPANGSSRLCRDTSTTMRYRGTSTVSAYSGNG
jgi:cyclic nucleotide-binding protein